MEKERVHNQVFHRIGDSFGSLVDTDHFLGRGSLGENSPVQPAFNLRRVGGGYEITLSLPAYRKEEIELTLEGHLLRVKAEGKEEGHSPEAFLYLGFQPNRQERIFYIPHFIDRQRIRASYHNGLLLISLPKKEEVPEPEVQHIPVE